MVTLVNRFTGKEFDVPDEKAGKFRAAGHKPAVVPEKEEKPEKPKKKKK